MKCLCGHYQEDHKERRDGTLGKCEHKNERGKKDCQCRKFECGHWRIKKIHTHGKKSKPIWVCKDKLCGEVIKRGEFKKKREELKRKNGKKM